MHKRKVYLREEILLMTLCVLAIIVILAAIRVRTKLPEFVDRQLTVDEQAEIIDRNSSLVDYVYLSPNATFPRENSINKITIHHMAGDIELERLGKVFSDEDRQASANYAIDTNGKIALYVEECNRAWSSSSPENDNQAITIEVANDQIGEDWHVSDVAYNALIELCTDICIRNNRTELAYTGDDTGNLTLHCMFADTECPGPYLKSRMVDIASTVNKQLTNGEFN